MHRDSWGQIRGEPFPPARRRFHQGPARIRKRLLRRQHIHPLQHSRCEGDATSECTQLLHQHQHQHLDEKGKQKMMHGHHSVPDCSGMRCKRRFKSFGSITAMLLAKLTMCPGASILYNTGKSREISQLTLTWVLSPLSHLPPHQCTSHTFPEVWTPCSAMTKSLSQGLLLPWQPQPLKTKVMNWLCRTGGRNWAHLGMSYSQYERRERKRGQNPKS